MDYIVVYFMALAVLMVGNGLIFVAQWRIYYQFKLPVNAFVASLTVTETLFAVFFVVASSVEAQVIHNEATEILLCYVTPYFQMLCLSSNVFCMLAIAFDLYRVVCSPTVNATGLAHKERRRRLTRWSLTAVWVSAVVYSFRAVPYDRQQEESDSADEHHGHEHTHEHENDDHVVLTGKNGTSGNGTSTTEEQHEHVCNLFIDDHFSNEVIRIVDLFVLFIIPVLGQLVLYTAVAIKLWSSQVWLSFTFLPHDAFLHRT